MTNVNTVNSAVATGDSATDAELTVQAFRNSRLAEIEAMRVCFNALHLLDPDSKRRVMRWLDDGALYPARTAACPCDEPPF